MQLFWALIPIAGFVTFIIHQISSSDRNHHGLATIKWIDKFTGPYKGGDPDVKFYKN